MFPSCHSTVCGCVRAWCSAGLESCDVDGPPWIPSYLPGAKAESPHPVTTALLGCTPIYQEPRRGGPPTRGPKPRGRGKTGLKSPAPGRRSLHILSTRAPPACLCLTSVSKRSPMLESATRVFGVNKRNLTLRAQTRVFGTFAKQPTYLRYFSRVKKRFSRTLSTLVVFRKRSVPDYPETTVSGLSGNAL